MTPNWELMRDQFVLWLWFGLPSALVSVGIVWLVRWWRGRHLRRLVDLMEATPPMFAVPSEQFVSDARANVERWGKLMRECKRAEAQRSREAVDRMEEDMWAQPPGL